MENLLELVKTTHNRELFLNYIELCRKEKSVSTISLNDSFETILASIGISDYNKLTEDVVQDIKAILLNAKTIKLSVDQVLSQEFITKLYALLFAQEKGLIEIELTPFSNGGFVMYKDGKIYNYLFDTLVAKVFLDNEFQAKLQELL